ncbi:P-loop containing nucleoside triphosphate hydrolase protein [Pelagophyceae sp. CCMP2097]|nr:P-loop containing nucleoside triphosphate hydrolase protein [Pelagophyceae sp. CCMP2097]|mmetsp:Transcript_32648/g.112982  ORF Transcript_32648/g.112982 Transcript_32648/m.112982 type:complete len:694 (+) Transcript_32648:69-2150(+)
MALATSGGDGAARPVRDSHTAVQVAIRIRPLHGHERQTPTMACDGRTVTLDGVTRFPFDHVFDERASQETVYDAVASPVVHSCLEGYNATIFAYGQTGTGKTHTMDGPQGPGALQDDGARGIIPRAVEQIFEHVNREPSAAKKFLVRLSAIQIYQETVRDLCSDVTGANLQIREDAKRGVYVEELSEWVVREPSEVYALMDRATSRRATGATRMNELSSRSHAVFLIIVEQSETLYVDDGGRELAPDEFARAMRRAGLRRDEAMARLENRVKQTFRVGKLNLVDLAGSERNKMSGASGVRLEESRKINASLSALGNVIAALCDKKAHVPYRDSKLTRLLGDSLGGNCKTTMLATISPSDDALSETLGTLKFATRAKAVTCVPKINEDQDQKSLLRQYERELKRLRAELEAKNRDVVDTRRLLEIDEQRKRAEQDRHEAVRALEQRSVEFMREKEEKRLLEEQIQQLTEQMASQLTSQSLGGVAQSDGGGHAPNDMRGMAAADRDAYSRLAELERERSSLEEEKAQVERYKQLLLKQRDIMIALTQRLNERDDQILMLQDELDAYDRNQAALENKLDEKTAVCIRLQRQMLEDPEARRPVPPPATAAHGAAAPSDQDRRISDLLSLLELRDKERRAVQTIFEKKIAVLVDSVSNAVDARSPARRDLDSLKRLVRAAVEALKHADSESQLPPAAK